MITATSSATAASAALSSGSSTSATDATASQDRFLKLLVAQLNNQDPMNPMDNAQMTSQMAQINTVTGIQQVNETLKSMAAQFTSMQVLQGSSMVGHDVLLAGSTLAIDNGVAKGAVDLTSSADTVTVQILSPGGEVLDTLNLGAKAAGHHTFEWDASNYQGQSVKFAIAAGSGGQSVSATPLARSVIESVSNENGLMKLNLKGGSSAPYSDISAIF